MINEERMSVYVRLGIRLLYKGLKSRDMEKKKGMLSPLRSTRLTPLAQSTRSRGRVSSYQAETSLHPPLLLLPSPSPSLPVA